MDISFLTEYMVPVIIGLCLCVGYVVKHWLKDLDNKYIPTICAVLGVVVAAWLHDFAVTPEVLLQGLASGLASTGMHQAVAQFIDKAKSDDKEADTGTLDN